MITYLHYHILTYKLILYKYIGLETSDEKKKKARQAIKNRHKRTPSQIERDRQRKLANKKAGPRDNEYKKTSYKGTDPKILDKYQKGGFLEDSISTAASQAAFEKRKKQVGSLKKETVAEIGIVFIAYLIVSNTSIYAHTHNTWHIYIP